MKILSLLLLASITIASCSSSEYNTQHQAKTLKQFNRAKHKEVYFTSNKRGDHNHPTVTKETRKSLKYKNKY